MPVAVQVQKVAVNGQATFTFDDNVPLYAAGISGFHLYYPDNTDHAVKQLSLILQAQSAGNTVTVSNTAVLQNGSGAELDPNSVVWIGVVAYVGADPGTLTLYGPTEQINSGQNSSAIASYIDYTPSAALSGFDLAYSDDAYDVAGINASASAELNGNSGYVTAVANMQDSNGHSASTATASGLLIATGAQGNPGIIIKTLKQQNWTEDVSVDMGQEVSDALCLITDFNVVYPSSDHYLLMLEVGPWKTGGDGNTVSVNPDDRSSVVVSGLHAAMSNDDGSWQDNNHSSCTVLVVGVAAST